MNYIFSLVVGDQRPREHALSTGVMALIECARHGIDTGTVIAHECQGHTHCTFACEGEASDDLITALGAWHDELDSTLLDADVLEVDQL